MCGTFINSRLLNMYKKYFPSVRFFWKKYKKDFGKYSVIEKPSNVSAKKSVPNHITTPSWYLTGVPLEQPTHIDIKSEEQIKKLRTSCKIASNILHQIGKNIKVGITTDEIDTLVHELCIKNNSYPSPLNYNGFPKSVCTSINNVVCHGIPDDRPLQDGDLINVDISIYYNGFHGDCSKTFLVGNVDEKGRELVKATEQCLNEAIEICKPGVPFKSIGHVIEYRAKKLGFYVVPDITGHGIGEYFHGPPDIYHCENTHPGVMKPGMSFTIEPALTQGGEEIVILEDNWTVLTLDKARSTQCEHTVLITKDGVDILTVPS